MHFHFIFQFWRRKLSAILLSSCLILLGLWTWAIFGTNNPLKYDAQTVNTLPTPQEEHKRIRKEQIPNSSPINHHVYILQKLIAQANRVLRLEREKDEEAKIAIVGKNTVGPISPAAAHKSATNTGILRFVKSTKHAPNLIDEASVQALALAARRKQTSVVGETYLFEEERLKILENQQRRRNEGLEALNNNNMEDESMLSSAEKQTQYEHELQRMGVPIIAGIGPEHSQAPNERLVHLDLKGAPPKLSFLKHLLPILKTLGATGLLIEYEDMFPYTGELEILSAHNAYKADELRDFLQTAVMHGLIIMPLVQTFGHMEYILKLKEFQHMREIAESPQSLCPNQKDSLPFIQKMLTQIIEFHMGHGINDLNMSSSSNRGSGTGANAISSYKFTHIHIGCDEVYRMGECEICRQHARNQLFLTHVTTIASFIRDRWPQLHVVIWDDMLRGMTLSELQHSHIGNYVEPMIWVYVSDIYHFIQPQLWETYSKVFESVWAASAFKGAFGESLMLAPLQNHLENNIHWLAVIAKEGGRFSKGFRGLALTGWSRYDHFAILCELLPVSLPSLMVSLSTVSRGYFDINAKENTIMKVLQCAFYSDSRRSGYPWLELQPHSRHSQLFLSCNYLGSMIYKYALRLNDKLIEARNYLQHVRENSAWMSDYNVRHNFSSTLSIQRLTAHTPPLMHELTGMAREAQQLMFDIFDEYTIGEFVEQQIYPVIFALRQHLERAEVLMKTQNWPRRPLPYARELFDWNLLSSVGSSLAEQRVQRP